MHSISPHGKDAGIGRTRNLAQVSNGSPGQYSWTEQTYHLRVAPGKILTPCDMFGEMALFTNTPCEANYVAKGPARIITIDRKLFLKRISEDPTLAFHPVQELARRIQALEIEIKHLKADTA